MVGFVPLAGIGAGIIGATVLTPLLTVPVLNVIGFSAAGPVAGTLAAGIQSGIGNVAASSLFASAQAIATGAAIPVLAQVIGGTRTGVVGMALAFVM
ncbi:hypothetical protein BDM02DRAFT_3107161 [Thelephora ganbajun]|uniref:Uncharacterized protein n=1 Tax=Thelephora ganbajun TaxID=370292 RepID=A0ACB6ZWQ8_THEGA|nr:hypothetical protein BDM02DRAFT_3107161 [Thelephora ganbajun]